MGKRIYQIKHFSKIIFFFLIFSSLILFTLSLICLIFINNNQANSNPYYKISGIKYSEATSVIQKIQWTDSGLPGWSGLLAGSKINQNFTALADNLGIISIPFDAHNRSIDDRIVFRLKETGKKDWHFQNTYNADQFQTDIPFPFGFPIIANSKNKAYTIQIESLSGKPGNSLSLSRKSNYFLTEYKFSKSQLLKNPGELSQFIVIKIIEQLSLLTVWQITFLLFSVLLPFIIYFLSTLYVNEIYFNPKFLNTIKSDFLKYIYNNSATIMVILLLLVIGSAAFYNFVKFPMITSTASRLDSFPTNDFYTVLYFKTQQLIKGQEMNQSVITPQTVDASGQALPLFFAPFLLLFSPDRYSAYLYFLGLVIVAYVLFYVLLMRKSDKQILNTGLIFLIAFCLSEPGFIGIYMGNVDILLAVLAGIFILYLFYILKNKSISIMQAICLGIFAGLLVNIKVTLLPFILIAVLFSRRIWISLLTTLGVFFSFIYIPNLFNSKSTITSLLGKILIWNNKQPLSFHFWGNHSFYVVSTYFTRCIELNTCSSENTGVLIAALLFIFTFLVPFLILKPIRKFNINKTSLISLLNFKKNKELALVFFALSDAFINLCFKIVYDYRLFFSLVVTLIIFKESVRSKMALTYCYLSMFSLLLGGLWVLQLNPTELWTIDSRLLKFFIIFHYFFLILASLAYWKKSSKNDLIN